MSKVTVGVVGLGSIARKAHLPVLTAHPQVEIIALASRSGARVTELATQYRLSLQGRTMDELLQARPQAAYVLSATEAHPEHAIQLLEGGIAVLLEKPLANDLAGARAIVQAAGRPDRMLMVSFNRRYAPAYRQAKGLFTGRQIELVQIHKHRNGDTSRWPLRQIIMDDAIHIIDLARFYAGDLTVQAATTRVGLTAAHLQSASGTVVQLSQSYGAGGQTERLELHGDGLSVVVVDMETLLITDQGKQRMERVGGSWTSTLEKRGILGATEHFLACLQSGTQPDTTAADAFRTQELAEAILAKGAPH